MRIVIGRFNMGDLTKNRKNHNTNGGLEFCEGGGCCPTPLEKIRPPGWALGFSKKEGGAGVVDLQQKTVAGGGK